MPRELTRWELAWVLAMVIVAATVIWKLIDLVEGPETVTVKPPTMPKPCQQALLMAQESVQKAADVAILAGKQSGATADFLRAEQNMNLPKMRDALGVYEKTSQQILQHIGQLKRGAEPYRRAAARCQGEIRQ